MHMYNYTAFRYHVTEYCTLIGTHSTVRGDKLLYGQIPDPFPQCGIGSGHARLQCKLYYSSRLCIMHLAWSQFIILDLL